jgi:hypothetical protein
MNPWKPSTFQLFPVSRGAGPALSVFIRNVYECLEAFQLSLVDYGVNSACDIALKRRTALSVSVRNVDECLEAFQLSSLIIE